MRSPVRTVKVLAVESTATWHPEVMSVQPSAGSLPAEPPETVTASNPPPVPAAT